MYKKLPLLLTAAVALLFVGGIAALVLLNNAHESTSKQLLAKEVSRLPVVSGCSEQSRAYQRGGVDTNSSWEVQYHCTGSATVAYGNILNGLRDLGYSMTWGDIGAFRSSNGQYQVDYSFSPTPNASNDTTPTTITMHIYRQGRSY